MTRLLCRQGFLWRLIIWPGYYGNFTWSRIFECCAGNVLRFFLRNLCDIFAAIFRLWDVTQNVRPVELARRLCTTPQANNRLTNLHHTTRIDGIDAALRAQGKRLEIRLA